MFYLFFAFECNLLHLMLPSSCTGKPVDSESNDVTEIPAKSRWLVELDDDVQVSPFSFLLLIQFNLPGMNDSCKLSFEKQNPATVNLQLHTFIFKYLHRLIFSGCCKRGGKTSSLE
jgi:hypothetical protein